MSQPPKKPKERKQKKKVPVPFSWSEAAKAVGLACRDCNADAAFEARGGEACKQLAEELYDCVVASASLAPAEVFAISSPQGGAARKMLRNAAAQRNATFFVALTFVSDFLGMCVLCAAVPPLRHPRHH